jgi:mono/diheme cytochrome c family protein
MSGKLRNVALIRVPAILLGIALAVGLSRAHAGDSTAAAPVQKWAKVSVELPASKGSFPPGNGADIANGQCLICHSAGMVLRQPPLSQEEWAAEINKMRNSFGAPLPADQVDALARYLHSIDGRKSPGGPATVDGQGS